MTELDFRARYGPWALVAGASEGIGAAFARSLAASGCDLVLVSRRREPLETLAAEVRDAHGVQVRVAPIDLTGVDFVAELDAVVADAEVGLVVHNAGADNNA